MAKRDIKAYTVHVELIGGVVEERVALRSYRRALADEAALQALRDPLVLTVSVRQGKKVLRIWDYRDLPEHQLEDDGCWDN